ncbi:hypothetical protein ANCCAN_21939 [Ancylostoma caninum]|uniref:Uncharacterized protein n=1 Tax=Ancylostoma caninum TaxID=29170 RepID=A0A368FJC4_ANCCA|nr:hypothetical protein ANCCAN_21939 [Ancylostoma caninum]
MPWGFEDFATAHPIATAFRGYANKDPSSGRADQYGVKPVQAVFPARAEKWRQQENVCFVVAVTLNFLYGAFLNFAAKNFEELTTNCSNSSRRSDDSMLSLATCGTAPIVAAESVDDLDAEVSILNGNLRDDGSGSETARSFDEGHRLLENTVTMLERQLRRYDARIQQLERLCELQQVSQSVMPILISISLRFLFV